MLSSLSFIYFLLLQLIIYACLLAVIYFSCSQLTNLLIFLKELKLKQKQQRRHSMREKSMSPVQSDSNSAELVHFDLSVLTSYPRVEHAASTGKNAPVHVLHLHQQLS